MSNFLQSILGSVGDQIGGELSQKAGIDSGQAKGALAVLTPVLLGGLKKQHENYGAKRVEGLIGAVGGEKPLENFGDILNGGLRQQTPDVGLGGLLGSRRGNETAESMSEKLGINKDLAMKLIPILAPIIIAYLMKKGRQDTPSNAGHMGQRSQMGGIARILDRDGDGNALDDIAGMILGGRGNQGGALGNILGGLLRG